MNFKSLEIFGKCIQLATAKSSFKDATDYNANLTTTYFTWEKRKYHEILIGKVIQLK